jgi:hypothetical protein
LDRSHADSDFSIRPSFRTSGLTRAMTSMEAPFQMSLPPPPNTPIFSLGFARFVGR